MEDRFILTDETLNYKNIIVKTDGIDLNDFNNNPQMFFNHSSDMPIGLWKDVSKEATLILATPDFDLEDPEAVKIMNKVKKGHIKSVSVGLSIQDYIIDENGSMIVLKSTLKEASIVPLPANKNAVKLFMDGVELNDEDITNLKLSYNNKNKKNDFMDNKVELETLQLSYDKQIEDLKLSYDAKVVELGDEIKELKNLIKEYKTKEIETYVENSIKEGKFKDEQKEFLLSLALENFETVKKLVESTVVKAVEPVIKLSEVVDKLKATKEEIKFSIEDESTWSFNDYRKHNPAKLKEMELNDKVKFDKLYNEYINE